MPDVLVLAGDIVWGILSAAFIFGLYKVVVFPLMDRNMRRGADFVEYLTELQGDVDAGIAAINDGIEQAKAAGIDVSKIALKPYRRPKGLLGERPLVLKHLEKPKEK